MFNGIRKPEEVNPQFRAYVNHIKRLSILEMAYRREFVLMSFSALSNVQNQHRIVYDVLLQFTDAQLVLTPTTYTVFDLFKQPEAADRKKRSCGVLVTGNEVLAFYWSAHKPNRPISVTFVRQHGLSPSEHKELAALSQANALEKLEMTKRSLMGRWECRGQRYVAKAKLTASALLDHMLPEHVQLVLEFLGWSRK